MEALKARACRNWSLTIIGFQIVASLVCGTACHDSSRTKMRAMMNRAQNRFSPVELQNAVVPVCDRYQTNTLVPVEVLPSEILALSDARPSFAMMSGAADTGGGTLDVFWGGGFGGYGVRVCPPGTHLSTNRIVRRLVRWGDGVAFYAE